MTDASVVTEPDLIIRREGGAGIIRLNRPKTINAMTLEMSEGIGFKIAMAGLDGGRLNIGACSIGGGQSAAAG